MEPIQELINKHTRIALALCIAFWGLASQCDCDNKALEREEEKTSK